MIVDFDGEVFLWHARQQQDWFFAGLPEALSADIREIPRPVRGFGSVRVEAQIGGSRWRTSIFPDAERGAYVLPLKKSVREAEGIVDGMTVRVNLDILDA